MDIAQARTLLAGLATEPSAALGPVGVAAHVSDATKAFEALAAEPAVLRELRDELLAATRSAAPGGRLYAALLLRVIDAPAATAALEAMLDSEEPCTLFPGGCMGASHWLGEAAGYLLGRRFSNPKRLARQAIETLARATDILDLPPDERAGGGRFPAAHAYQLLLGSPHLPARRDDLEALLAVGAPAACVYGALLLRALDPAAAHARLLALASSPDTLEETVGAHGSRWTTVGAVARRYLPDELVRTLPPAPTPAPTRRPLARESLWSRLLDRLSEL